MTIAASAGRKRLWRAFAIAILVNGVAMTAFWSDRLFFGGRQHLMEGILLVVGGMAALGAIVLVAIVLAKTSK